MNFFLAKIFMLTTTAVKNYRQNRMAMHRIRRIPYYETETRLLLGELEAFVGFTYLGYIPRADFFGNESLPKSRARACNCSGNDKADSVATSEVQGDTKTRQREEGKSLVLRYIKF